jgi:hypothetical protein
MTFVIADGAPDLVVGDLFSIEARSISPATAVALNLGVSDGSQNAVGILCAGPTPLAVH